MSSWADVFYAEITSLALNYNLSKLNKLNTISMLEGLSFMCSIL